jgi:rhodanese-related sulfurtransferase
MIALAALPAPPGLAVLDVRDEDAFRRGHLPGSGNVPAGDLAARRAELPPRDAEVLVVAGSAADAEAGARALEALGYTRVAWLDAALAAVPDGLAERGAGARLWRPAPFLERVLPALPRGRAIDVAAGSGREAVLLALHGFEVEAWDHAPEALARAEALAGRWGTRIATVEADLERPGVVLPEARYDLVVCFRFLHRPLLPAMARALRPGGHLVYETYRTGQERFGRPTHARFLLRPGELREAFPDLEVLAYEEQDPAQGPVTARLWARRPGAPDGPAAAAPAAGR